MTMKKFLFLVSGCLMSLVASGQSQFDAYQSDTGMTDDVLSLLDQQNAPVWHRQGAFSLSASQVSLSNWAAGGDNTVAGNAALTYSLDYEHDRHLWMNRLELGYGLSKTDTWGTRKTTDRIYLNSLYGYKMVEHWYGSFFVNFQSQFAKGFNYGVSRTDYISKFLAPGYLSLGPGVTWIPKKWFMAFLSPATWRGTFVCDDYLSALGAYGVKPGKRLHSEFGADLKLVARLNPLPGMSVYSRLDLYSNYLHKPQNIDVTWDTIVTMAFNKWLSASLTLNMIYDDDVRFVWKPGGRPVPKIQFKEVLGLGFLAAF
jgi:hypothetical protein